MVDSLFSFQDAATDYGDLANELLTTVLDGCGSRWTLKTAHTSDDEVRRSALDPPGSAKPPENWTLGSGEVVTTSVAVRLTPVVGEVGNMKRKNVTREALRRAALRSAKASAVLE